MKRATDYDVFGAQDLGVGRYFDTGSSVDESTGPDVACSCVVELSMTACASSKGRPSAPIGRGVTPTVPGSAPVQRGSTSGSVDDRLRGDATEFRRRLDRGCVMPVYREGCSDTVSIAATRVGVADKFPPD